MRLIHRLGFLGSAGLLAVFLWGGVAAAQDDTPADPDAYVGGNTTVATTPTELTPEPPEEAVRGESLDSAASGSATAAGSGSATAPESVQSSTLAFTGGDVLALSAIGAAAVVLGALAVAARRRSARPAL